MAPQYQTLGIAAGIYNLLLLHAASSWTSPEPRHAVVDRPGINIRHPASGANYAQDGTANMIQRVFDIDGIKSLIPHREPFLFVDSARVNEDLSGIATTRQFARNENYFPGHFPEEPVVPGVLLIECMAQSAHILLCCRAGNPRPGYLVGVESATFNDFIYPPATVTFDTTFLHEVMKVDSGGKSGRIFSLRSQGRSGGKRCVRASINIFLSTTAAPRVIDGEEDIATIS
jgi:3-hydroxymyristoyl/3-hydroxydecanoyl-(acyl carrier protein) dehydratase